MSLKNVSIISPEPGNGRNVVALGLVALLAKTNVTSVFRPAVSCTETFTDTLLDYANAHQTREQAIGVTLRDARINKQSARAQIVSKFIDTNAQLNPAVRVIVGSDRNGVGDPERFSFNADVSADLQAPVLLTVCTLHRTPQQVHETIEACTEVIVDAGTKVIGVFITGCDENQCTSLRTYFKDYDVPVWTVPFLDLEENATPDDAIGSFAAHVPADELLRTLDSPFVPPTTPYAFQYDILARAKKNRKTIVLPEGADDRIITAANYLLESNVVDIVIIGERDEILERGKKLDLKSLDKARFQSMEDEQLLTEMIDKLCELRAKKGMTPDVARKTLRDPNYFGTMLVVLGQADGLVSGAISSTANTPVRSSCASKTMCPCSPTVRSTSIPIRSSWQTSHCSPPRPPRRSQSNRVWACSHTPLSVPARARMSIWSSKPRRSCVRRTRTWRLWAQSSSMPHGRRMWPRSRHPAIP